MNDGFVPPADTGSDESKDIDFRIESLGEHELGKLDERWLLVFYYGDGSGEPEQFPVVMTTAEKNLVEKALAAGEHRLRTWTKVDRT